MTTDLRCDIWALIEKVTRAQQASPSVTLSYPNPNIAYISRQ